MAITLRNDKKLQGVQSKDKTEQVTVKEEGEHKDKEALQEPEKREERVYVPAPPYHILKDSRKFNLMSNL